MRSRCTREEAAGARPWGMRSVDPQRPERRGTNTAASGVRVTRFLWILSTCIRPFTLTNTQMQSDRFSFSRHHHPRHHGRAHTIFTLPPPRNLISTAVVARVFILRFPRRGSPTAPITAAPPTCPVRRASAVSSTPHRCVHSHLGVRSHVRVHSHPARPSSPLRAHPSELTPSSSPLHSCSHPSDSRLFHRLRARTPHPPPPTPHTDAICSVLALSSAHNSHGRAPTRAYRHTHVAPLFVPSPASHPKGQRLSHTAWRGSSSFSSALSKSCAAIPCCRPSATRSGDRPCGSVA